MKTKELNALFQKVEYMKKEIAVCLTNDNNVNAKITFDALRKAGFSKVFVQYYDKEFEIDQKEQVEICRKENIDIIFAHLGYQNINRIWDDDEIGKEIVERYKKDLDDIKSMNIGMVIMHASSGFNTASCNEMGLKKFKEIADYAEKLNIKIAFENTKMINHLEYILDNITSSNIGLCYDVGHQLCNSKGNFDISKYKGRIFAVHLHDNDSTSDQHLLPFDGKVAWTKIIKTLKEAEYDGPITLEICNKSYRDMDIEDYYKEAYKRALALQNLWY